VGHFGIKPAAPLTLRQVGEIYFQEYLSPKTGQAARPERAVSLERHDGYQC
jgi:hypothetical protein